MREVEPATLFGDDTAGPGRPEAPAARARGILQRAENLYKELPGVRAGLHERKDLAETDLRDLEGLGEAPFEHAAELDATRLELEELTHELRREQHSDAAVAKAAAAAERLAAAGREPGWSLWLNPTPALAESVGVASVAELRETVLATQAQNAADYARRRYATDNTHPADTVNNPGPAAANTGAGEAAPVQAARRAVGGERGPTDSPRTAGTVSTPPQAPVSARPPIVRSQARNR